MVITRIVRTSLLVLPLLCASVVSPAIYAITPPESAISSRAEMEPEEFAADLVSTGFELFYAGPQWFLNALSNPRSRNPFVRTFMYDSAGDRLSAENGYVGTLHDVFDVGLFSNIATFTGSGSPKTFTSTVAALGGSATWSATPSSANWVPGVSETNWTTGAGNYPGDTSGTTTNQDTATFLTSNTTAITINSSTLNVKSLIFGSAAVAPSNYTIGSTGGNSLLLSSAGEIAIPGLPSGTTGVIETVNAPLVLEPLTSTSAGTYQFRNSSTSNTNSLNIGGAISGGTTTQGITLTLAGTNTGSNTVGGAISNGNAVGGLSVAKINGGTWILTGNNTYTGTTTVSGGTLTVAGTSGNQALGGTSRVTVSSGTLLQTTSNQINDAGDMTLSGGTYRLGTGVSEGTAGTSGLGSLTLTSNSIIDLSATNILHFDNSSTLVDPTNIWTGTLSIYNWTGTPVTGGGSEQILFGTDLTGLSATQLAMIQFYSGTNTGAYTPGAVILSTGEIVPVPEPSTWIGAALALAALGFTQRRRIRGLIARPA